MSNQPFRIEVEGFDELQRKIRLLSDPRDKKKEMLGLLRQVAGSTVNKARDLAPISEKPHTVSGKRAKKVIQPGTLKKSIGTITGKRGDAVENPTIYVGPRAKGTHDGWYGAMVEAGHNVYRNSKTYTVFKRKKTARTRNVLQRVRGRGANNKVGFVQGWFYLRKSYEATQGKVAPEAAEKVAKFIQRRIDRL